MGGIFFLLLFGLPLIFIWFLLPRFLSTSSRVLSPVGHFFHGFAGIIAMVLFFASLGLLPLPKVTTLSYAAPLLPVIFTAIFMGETARVIGLVATALGLTSAMIIFFPHLTVQSGAEDDTHA